MNFYVWTKPPKEDIDVYEELGNPGWNWKSYQELTMRTEEYVSCALTVLNAFDLRPTASRRRPRTNSRSLSTLTNPSGAGRVARSS